MRSVIGEPTGTSKKFCHQMVAAVKHYFATEHQLTLPDSILTTIPLEGEGKVEERVAKHYHQLLANIAWLEAISSADVILWATHSQGTPVSFLLLKQLLDLGHIHAHRQPICVLAMAGIGHGPFPVLKGSLIVKVQINKKVKEKTRRRMYSYFLFLLLSLLLFLLSSTLKPMQPASSLNLWILLAG